MVTQKKTKGTLEVICGPMFCGKSEELMRRLRRAKIAQQNVLVFKHSLDNRSTIEHISSHDGNKLEACATDNPDTIKILGSPNNINVIGIDEVQFFHHGIISVICQLIESGKRVIIAGLDLDFRALPFGPMPLLLSIADSVTKLCAICTLCGSDAHHSQRLVNGQPAQFDDPIIQVGAQESYQARCRNCFIIDKTPSSVYAQKEI